MPFVDLGKENGLLHFGWEQDGALVATIALERVDAEEVAVRELESSDAEGERALLATIVRGANVQRLVSDFAVDGFDHDGARWVRELGDVPGTNVAATTLQRLESVIRASWSRETSDDPDEWTAENPARGQCAVTALLVRELLGGEILIANVLRDGVRVERHAWNRLASGITVDLTRDQYRGDEVLGEAALEEPFFTKRHPERFALLRERVFAALG